MSDEALDDLKWQLAVSYLIREDIAGLRGWARWHMWWPLWRGHGLGIALFSYDGAVHWGFNGDYDLMEDLPAFVSSVSEAFDELLEVAKNPPEPKANKSFPPMGTR